MQPIYLFADSQALFWRKGGTPFIDSIRQNARHPTPKAAYIGASNRDVPEFYTVFEAAMESIGIRDCSFVRSSFCEEDQRALSEAEIILLAGGDVEIGWNVFETTGMKELIERKYHEGAILMGVSAGSVHLGMYGAVRRADSSIALIDTFKLVPFVVDAHDEADDWETLHSVIQLLEGAASGIGISRGAGLLYHPDQTVEAIRSAASEFSMVDGKLKRELLLPAGA